jgi:orotidine-5'-phosphate decarboxylase
MHRYIEKLAAAQQTNNSCLCVGLDPVMERLPEVVLDSPRPLLNFGRNIIKATADLVCAYKPNLAFWLAEGPEGIHQLQELVADVPDHLPVILDAKFNDVGHTAAAYARVAFEVLRMDAVTVNPYLGHDGVRPFLDEEEHGIFLLARTSNPSAPDLQNQPSPAGPLYENVARLATRWDTDHPGTCGLVVGATYPEELAHLREIAPNLPFLIPGVGAQGGSLVPAVLHGPTAEGIGPVINSSRGIIYASRGSDFAEAARAAASILRDRINQLRDGGTTK